MNYKVFFLSIFIIVLFFPLTSYCDDISEDDDLYYSINTSSDISDIPTINARRAIVFDRTSKQIIYGKNENDICKMASTTKIMSCLVALENGHLEDVVTISAKSASTGGSRLGLSKGDKITVKDLLYGLMMKSGNDAAVALAEYIGGSVENFANMMNEKASEIGLKFTHFVTPHGLDDDNHCTTAKELAILADYALKNETFLKIVGTKTYTITQNGYPKTLNNTNELLGYFEGIYGVKTGFTNGANRCLVTSCKRGDLDVICVVLGCDTKKDRTQDSIDLLNYTFKNYSVVDIQSIIEENFDEWYSLHKNSFYIDKGVSNSLDLGLDYGDFTFFNLPVKNSDINKIEANITFTPNFNAPLDKNSTIGIVTLSLDNEPILSIDILNKNYIAKKGFWDYFLYFFQNYCSFFV